MKIKSPGVGSLPDGLAHTTFIERWTWLGESTRLVRSGPWESAASDCRSGFRYGISAQNSDHVISFRPSLFLNTQH